jgi:predicted AAA+ superfamily ATPase
MLHLLELAKICYSVEHSSSNGVPLRAEANPKVRKMIFLDVGLFNKACGLTYPEIDQAKDLNMIHSGAVSEQFIGQQLLYRKQFYEEPELFYWSREKAQSSAEVDYVVTHGTKIVPIEVKSGKTGSLKSLSVFIKEKALDLGIRFNGEGPSFSESSYNLKGDKGQYRLLSLPLYMVEETDRILGEI